MVANAVNLNESYLSRIFKSETGKNLMYFINEVKMKKAILKEDVFSLATYKNTSPNVCKSWNEVITKL